LTDSDEIARHCYDALIGTPFEEEHGWHVNLMPNAGLKEFPEDWEIRAITKQFKLLEAVSPCPVDLLTPKLRRGEPRDIAHSDWAKRVGLLD